MENSKICIRCNPLRMANSEEEIIELCNYKNLQPLCSKINRNIKKGNINY